MCSPRTERLSRLPRAVRAKSSHSKPAFPDPCGISKGDTRLWSPLDVFVTRVSGPTGTAGSPRWTGDVGHRIVGQNRIWG